MKKFLSLILLICITLISITLITGCKKKKPSSGSETESTPIVQVEEKLELETNNIFLTLGEKKNLQASYNEIEGKTLTWTSSNSQVVSVDENGVIDALKVGEATVTAKYGSKEATCAVEVSLSGNVPTLAFAESISEQVSVMKGAKISLGAKVRFNGKEFSDAEIEYDSSDKSVGEIVNGEFVAKDKVGSTKVSVFATWRGQIVRSEIVTFNVVAEKTVLLNGGRTTSMELFLTDEHEGVNYITEQVISSVFVSDDGKEITSYELGVLDEAVATIVENDGEYVITGNKAGKTQLVVSYDNVEFYFDIVVKRPVAEYEKVIEFSLTDNAYLNPQNLTLEDFNTAIDGFENISSYEIKGKEIKIESGKFDFNDGLGQEIVLYNATVGYKVVFDVYKTIIDELDDFKGIYAGDKETTVTGSFMLSKDLIAPDYVFDMPSEKVPNDFAGSFDGKGHVLSFTIDHGETYRFGLFGKFFKSATIKNVAFNNITTTGTTGKNTAGLICAECLASEGTSTMKNVYINVNFIEKAYVANMVVMYNANESLKAENVIVYAPNVPIVDGVTNTYGSFSRGNLSSAKQCYVISNIKIHVSPDDPNSEKFKKNIPTLCSSFEEMQGKDFSLFDLVYWDIDKNGFPVWKTLVDELTFEQGNN